MRAMFRGFAREANNSLTLLESRKAPLVSDWIPGQSKSLEGAALAARILGPATPADSTDGWRQSDTRYVERIRLQPAFVAFMLTHCVKMHEVGTMSRSITIDVQNGCRREEGCIPCFCDSLP
jgi:hypothetical protein